MGRHLVERLARPECQVNVSVQREVADTAVGNTAGARGEYRATGIGVTAEITRIAGDDVLMIYDQYVGADMPATPTSRRWCARSNASHGGADDRDAARWIVARRVYAGGSGCRGAAARTGVIGEDRASGQLPTRGQVGETLFDSRLSIVDDPLTPGRPSSRPIDDECVPSRVTGLWSRASWDGSSTISKLPHAPRPRARATAGAGVRQTADPVYERAVSRRCQYTGAACCAPPNTRRWAHR